MAGNGGPLSFSQLEKLWIQAGGSPGKAAVAAAIALAESNGNPSALNNTPSTGDYSVGLWQINYYGSLAPSRTAQFGPPQALTSPLANAKAAVAISGDGSNFTPWTTYTSGAYLNHADGGSPASLYQAPARPGGTVAQVTTDSFSGSVDSFVGDLPVIGGLISGISAASDMAKVIGWLLSPKHWAMAFEALVGIVLIGYGFMELGRNDRDEDTPSLGLTDVVMPWKAGASKVASKVV